MSEPLATPDALGGAPILEDARARRRLIAMAEVVLCSGGPTQLAIGALLRAAGWAPDDAAGHLSLPFVLTLSLADTVALIVLMVLLMRARGERALTLWVGQRPLRREILYGLLTVPLLVIGAGILLNAVRLLMPWSHNVATNPLEQLATTPGEVAMFALVAIVAGGVREELQRAFLLHRFEQHLGGTGIGVIVLSIAFGLGHSLQGWDAAITTGTLGAYWALMYVRRRSSVAPIVSHAAFNALEIVRISLGSG